MPRSVHHPKTIVLGPNLFTTQRLQSWAQICSPPKDSSLVPRSVTTQRLILCPDCSPPKDYSLGPRLIHHPKTIWTIVHEFLKSFYQIFEKNHGVSLFSPSRPTTIVHNSSQYLVLMQLISTIISHKPGPLSFPILLK